MYIFKHNVAKDTLLTRFLPPLPTTTYAHLINSVSTISDSTSTRSSSY